MPLTFPSHAAAVLPWCRERGRLPPTALIIGSCAPDFAYLFDTSHMNFHVWPGVLWPCVPIAIAMYVLFDGLVLPSLRRSLPVLRGIEWGRLAATRGLPQTWRGWLTTFFAIELGTLTHLVWDGFTHLTRFPARVLYADVVIDLGVKTLSLPALLQVLSSIVGLLLVLWAAKLRYPRLPHVTTAPSREAFVRLLVLVAAGVGASWLVLVARWGVVVATSPFGGAWLLFWYAARGLMVALVLASIIEHQRHRARGLGNGLPNQAIDGP